MTKLIYATTKNRDLFYALGVEISDPIFYIESNGRKYVFLDAREFGVLTEKSGNRGIEAIPVESLLEEARGGRYETGIANKLALLILKKFAGSETGFSVPFDFPLNMADFLRAQGITLTVQNPFYPERAIKTKEEISRIKETAAFTLNIFRKIEAILKAAEINGDHLIYEGETLTSEFLKKEAAIEMARRNLIDSEGLIISSGPHAAIPHHSGTGPIKPGAAIVCDIFPRHRDHGYFADIARTYAKGTPSEEIKKMYDAVRRAQEAGVQKIRAGVPAKEIHHACAESLKESGFETSEGRGFVHSTGHGVGLEVHETPSVGANSEKPLEAGNIITVEPGLYYPDLGGVRIEDMFLATENGAVCLTEYPRELVIGACTAKL